MPKIKYLTEDKSGKKLRRNVPQELRNLAGQSAWVERVSGTPLEIRECANLFAVKTDGYISSLRSQSTSAAIQGGELSENRSGFRIRLSKIDAKRLALIYLQNAEEERIRGRFYSVDGRWSELDRAEAIADAAADYGEALRAAEGKAYSDESDPEQSAAQLAIQLLIEAQFVNEDRFQTTEVGRFNKRLIRELPPELMENKNFELLCRYIQEAEVTLSCQWLNYLQTGQRPELRSALSTGQTAPIDAPINSNGGGSHTIGDLVDAFNAAKEKEGVSNSRQSQFRIVTRSLLEELGDSFALEDVTRKHCENLSDLYLRIPSHATQHYPNTTLRDAAEASEKNKGLPTARYDAGKKNLTILQSIFQFAIQLDWMVGDPTSKVSIMVPLQERRRQARNKGYEPFTMDELKIIFSAPLYTGCKNDGHGYDTPGSNIIKRHRYWVPLIGLYSGMRAGEILQLETGDIVTGKTGVIFFDIHEDPNRESSDMKKSLKNVNSWRKVPIHPELVRLGFVDWARAQPTGRLFPEARAGENKKLSDRFSKWFNSYLTKRGVWVPRKKVFHSFRGTFADRLKHAGVPLDKREAIMGWEPAGKMDARYGEGFTIEALSEEMEKTGYPELDFSFLFPHK